MGSERPTLPLLAVRTLFEDALKSVYGLHTSQDVWLALAKKYNRVSATRKLDLQRRVQTTVKGSKTMGVYLSEIKSLCDQLDSIGAPITEHEKIYGVLNGLGKEYEAVSTVIEHSMDQYPGLCFEDVVHKLTSFDDKLKAYEQVQEVTPHQAYYTNRGGYSGRGRGKYRGGYCGLSLTLRKEEGFHNSLVISQIGPQKTSVQHVRSVASMGILRTSVTEYLMNTLLSTTLHIKLTFSPLQLHTELQEQSGIQTVKLLTMLPVQLNISIILTCMKGLIK